MASDWMTVTAAVEQFSVGARTIRQLIKEGTARASGTGAATKVRRSDLVRHFERTAALVGTRDQIKELATNGLSIEAIARTTGATRYRVEKIVEPSTAPPTGVPYRYRKLKEDADIAGRYRSGDSAEDIAHDLGVSVTLIFDELKRQKVSLRGRVGSWVLTYEDVLTREFLWSEYVEKQRGAWEIAMEIGCSEATVRNWMRRHQITPRPISQRRRAYKYPPALLNSVATGDVTIEAAAIEVGCSRTELRRALRRAGLNLPKRLELSREFLELHYVQQRKSCPLIASETGWSTQTVRDRLVELGIPRRLGRQGQYLTSTDTPRRRDPVLDDDPLGQVSPLHEDGRCRPDYGHPVLSTTSTATMGLWSPLTIC